MKNLDAIADRAIERGMRIAVAESLTCGMLASTIGKAHDAGEWFLGGVVAYDTGVKHEVLGVEEGVDPVSGRCAEQLARGVRELLGATIAVSTTGVGGPQPQGPHPAGTVFLGWADADGSGHTRLHIDGDPERVLADCVKRAIDVLAERIETEAS